MRAASLLRVVAVLTASTVLACSDDSLTDPTAPLGLALDLRPAVDTILIADTITSADRSPLTLSAKSVGLPVQTPRGVVWTSSNPSVAFVDSTGAVHPVGLGTTTVTARVNGTRATATVVVAYRATQLVLVPSALTGFVGDTLQLTARALDAKGALVTGTAYTFSATDPTVALVVRTGTQTVRVSLLKPGAVRVNVSAAGLTASATGTVLARP